MAAKCPKCGEKLHIYDIKAECKHCGANIPNYNWEARLEEDNKIAEEKFQLLYYKLNDFRYATIGTRLRIWRIVMSFLPAIGFILPWAQLKSEADTLSYDLFGIFTDGANTLNFFGILFKDIGGLLSAENPARLYVLGFLLMLLNIVVIVAAFFLIFITFRNFKTKAVVIADMLSIIITCAATLMFFMSDKAVSAAAPFTVGTLNFENASSGAMWGVYVYIALLCVALIGNLLVLKAPVKSKELLEEERLERVRIKEEKEEAERIRKEAARAEAEKKAEEEKAEKIRKAREALAERENKK